jgi:hypothetical protein
MNSPVTLMSLESQTGHVQAWPGPKNRLPSESGQAHPASGRRVDRFVGRRPGGTMLSDGVVTRIGRTDRVQLPQLELMWKPPAGHMLAQGRPHMHPTVALHLRMGFDMRSQKLYSTVALHLAFCLAEGLTLYSTVALHLAFRVCLALPAGLLSGSPCSRPSISLRLFRPSSGLGCAASRRVSEESNPNLPAGMSRVAPGTAPTQPLQHTRLFNIETHVLLLTQTQSVDMSQHRPTRRSRVPAPK